MIRFDNVGKAFRHRRNKNQIIWPLRNFTASIGKGESTAILTPEGGGKTTLIDLVAGTEVPTEGEITRGARISWPAGFRGMINPKMTARQNLRFLTDAYGHDFRSAYDFVQDFTELGRYMDQVVRQCTNEQRQRLALAMLLAMNFDFILVDDTFEGGDRAFRARLAQFFEENQNRITFLMATSNARLAERYCKRIGILLKGAVTFYDTPEEGFETFRRLTDADA